ncbi:hypothetical protein H1C71_003608, partial [Ictidomys tridecemlineatus]
GGSPASQSAVCPSISLQLCKISLPKLLAPSNPDQEGLRETSEKEAPPAQPSTPSGPPWVRPHPSPPQTCCAAGLCHSEQQLLENQTTTSAWSLIKCWVLTPLPRACRDLLGLLSLPWQGGQIPRLSSQVTFSAWSFAL